MDWINSNFLSAIIGAAVGVGTTLLTIYIENKRNVEKEKYDRIISYVEKCPVLFKAVIDSHTQKDIDYASLREELNKNLSIFFLIPIKSRNKLHRLYNYINLSGEEFLRITSNINKILDDIYWEVYGVGETNECGK